MDTIDRINKLMKERGMNGAELSRIIGVSSAVYSQWNTRKTTPSNKNLARVAAALNVPVSYPTGEEQKESSLPDGRELSPLKKEALDLIEAMDDNTLRKFIKATKAMLEE